MKKIPMCWNRSLYIMAALLFTITIGNAIKCHKCDSIALEACAMSLNETELPTLDCSSLQCGVSIVDSVTYRGCGDNTPTIEAPYSRFCPENLCNKGVFPPGRLKCYHCNGNECIGKPMGKPNPCRNFFEEDQCYTDIILTEGATEVYRGCKSDQNRTLSSNVRLCGINGCNDGLVTDKIRCAQCDSQSGLGCKRDSLEGNRNDCSISQYSTCELNPSLSDSEYCFTYHMLDHVVRGCSSDPIHQLLSKDRIEKCTSDLCNIQCLSQQLCLSCDSNIEKDCLVNVTTIAPTKCDSPEMSSCFMCEYNDFRVERDCGSPPRSLASTCYHCDNYGSEEICNRKSFSRCYSCDSENNVNCANWEAPGPIDIEECSVAGANCIIATLMDGTTQRGCETPEFNCTSVETTKCVSCEGNYCNTGPFL